MKRIALALAALFLALPSLAQSNWPVGALSPKTTSLFPVPKFTYRVWEVVAHPLPGEERLSESPLPEHEILYGWVTYACGPYWSFPPMTAGCRARIPDQDGRVLLVADSGDSHLYYRDPAGSWWQLDQQGGGGGGDYLPLSGGTLTGDLTLASTGNVDICLNMGNLFFDSGTGGESGGEFLDKYNEYIRLYTLQSRKDTVFLVYNQDPTYVMNLDVEGSVEAGGYRSSDGSAGVTATLTFDATSPGSVTSLTVKSGLITGYTTVP